MWLVISQGSHSFLLPKTCTIDVLGDHLAKDVKLTPEGSQKIRFFEITSAGRRKDRDFAASEMIGNLQEPTDVYAEEIPLEEIQIQEDETLISVFHFSKEPSRWHGVPFRFVVKPVRITKAFSCWVDDYDPQTLELRQLWTIRFMTHPPSPAHLIFSFLFALFREKSLPTLRNVYKCGPGRRTRTSPSIGSP